MLTLVILEVFVLLAVAILCFAAYKIKAKRFEFSTSILQLASFKITITSDEDPEPSEPTTPEPRNPPKLWRRPLSMWSIARLTAARILALVGKRSPRSSRRK